MSDEKTSEAQKRSANPLVRLFTTTLPVESRLLLTLLVFLAIILAVGWAALNEPKRMETFTAQYHARSIQRGAVIFDSSCAPCHGNRGEGLEGVAPALNDPALFDGSRLKEVGWSGSLEDYVKLTVAAGRPVQSAQWSVIMPTWGQDYGGPMRPDEVQDVVNYVLNWGVVEEAAPPPAVAQAPTATPSYAAIGTDMDSPLPPGDAARGEALFSGAQPAPDGRPLGCNGCHSLDGAAGVGPTALGISGRLPAGYDSIDYYLREAILLPEAHKVPGFESVAMPANFGDRLAAQDLADIIAYLLALD